MPTTLESVIIKYLRSGNPAQRTREEYSTTLRKWRRWGGAVPLEEIGRREIREFLDWVYEEAITNEGTNPGRTANKVRSHLCAAMTWALDQELLDTLPRFPKIKPQRVVAGRHYLTKSEINALYFATYQMMRPRGWNDVYPVGRYWRSALVLFFNYGIDTGTLWKTLPFHEPILWRHVTWGSQSPDRQVKARSRYGWLFYRRVKTGKDFWRPMNRTVRLHLKSILPASPDPDSQVFLGGSTRPNNRFRALCDTVGIQPKTRPDTGETRPWVLKDLRKTCATYYDEHVPESSVEILGHSAGGITYRHYAHRAPLAFRAIMTLPQPSAFTGLARGFDGQCPCCRREFLESGG